MICFVRLQVKHSILRPVSQAHLHKPAACVISLSFIRALSNCRSSVDFSPELLCPHVTILHARLAACRTGMPPCSCVIDLIREASESLFCPHVTNVHARRAVCRAEPCSCGPCAPASNIPKCSSGLNVPNVGCGFAWRWRVETEGHCSFRLRSETGRS